MAGTAPHVAWLVSMILVLFSASSAAARCPCSCQILSKFRLAKVDTWSDIGYWSPALLSRATGLPALLAQVWCYLLAVAGQQQVCEGRGVRVGEGQQRQRALQLGQRRAVGRARLRQRCRRERQGFLGAPAADQL